MPVPAAPPAMKAPIAEPVAAIAEHGLVGADHAGLDRRQRHHHLEGRAGRIHPARPFVVQRAMGVLQQRRVVRPRDAAHELVRLEARGRGQRQQVAALVTSITTAAALCPPRRACACAAARDRGSDADPAPGSPSSRSSSRITRPTALTSSRSGARLAAQARGRSPRSSPRLPIWNSGMRRIGSGVPTCGQIAFGHPPDIAHDMRGLDAVRVMPGQADLGLDAGQGGRVDVHLGRNRASSRCSARPSPARRRWSSQISARTRARLLRRRAARSGPSRSSTSLGVSGALAARSPPDSSAG